MRRVVNAVEMPCEGGPRLSISVVIAVGVGGGEVVKGCGGARGKHEVGDGWGVVARDLFTDGRGIGVVLVSGVFGPRVVPSQHGKVEVHRTRTGARSGPVNVPGGGSR